MLTALDKQILLAEAELIFQAYPNKVQAALEMGVSIGRRHPNDIFDAISTVLNQYPGFAEG